MKENKNRSVKNKTVIAKKFTLKTVNSFYFRATLFLLGLGGFLPLPMCIGFLPSMLFQTKITNKTLKIGRFAPWDLRSYAALALLRGARGL